jgi:predicted nuclease of predicted toxin-antitoxin system
MIRLYLDEDVPEAIAMALRLRGYDVITVKEASNKGLTDLDQIQYAISEERVLFTHNIADFCKIHSGFINKGYEHNGLIVTRQLPIGVIVKALLRLLSSVNYEKIRNNIIWLSDWIT